MGAVGDGGSAGSVRVQAVFPPRDGVNRELTSWEVTA